MNLSSVRGRRKSFSDFSATSSEHWFGILFPFAPTTAIWIARAGRLGSENSNFYAPFCIEADIYFPRLMIVPSINHPEFFFFVGCSPPQLCLSLAWITLFTLNHLLKLPVSAKITSHLVLLIRECADHLRSVPDYYCAKKGFIITDSALMQPVLWDIKTSLLIWNFWYLLQSWTIFFIVLSAHVQVMGASRKCHPNYVIQVSFKYNHHNLAFLSVFNSIPFAFVSISVALSQKIHHTLKCFKKVLLHKKK